MQTLIITEGNRIYKCGTTMVVGSEWVGQNDLTMQICCSCFSGIFIYKEIDFNVFRYCLSRMRSPERIIQKDHNRTPVFVNFNGVWFGREQVVDLLKDQHIDMTLLEEAWNNYWRKK